MRTELRAAVVTIVSVYGIQAINTELPDFVFAIRVKVEFEFSFELMRLVVIVHFMKSFGRVRKPSLL